MMAGSTRSAGVMEWMIASTWSICRSSIAAEACFKSFGTPGSMEKHPRDGAHLPHLLELLEEVLEGEPPLEDGRCSLGGDVLVHGALGLLDEAEHVAHPEDAVGHPVRMELVEVVELLAGRGEGDGPAHHLLDREGRPAPGVTVQLGEDDPVEGQCLVEGGRRGHRVLPGHGVDDQERVVGVHDDRRSRRISSISSSSMARSAGGVDDHDVSPEPAGLLDPGGGHRHRIGRLAEHADPGLPAEHP